MENKQEGMHTPNSSLPVLFAADEIPPVFPAIDNDLAAENLENDFDMTAADQQDFHKK